MFKHIKNIVFTRKFSISIILPLLLFTLISGIILPIFSSAAYAESINAHSKGKRIFDKASLLTEEEVEKLEALSREYEGKLGVEIIILTHNDDKATYPEKYIEDFEDSLPKGDRVYFLYDVSRKELFMEGYGIAETYITSKRMDKIFDSVADDIRNGNYFDAFEKYIKQTASYMEDDSELNYNHKYNKDKTPAGFDPSDEFSYDDKYDYDKYYRAERVKNNIFFNIWFQLILSLIIGGIVVGILAYNSGGTMTAGANDYMDKSRSGLIGRRDHYIRSTITKTRKPSSDSGSGSGTKRGGFNSQGFRGGVSAGGRSHSSGGRKL